MADMLNLTIADYRKYSRVVFLTLFKPCIFWNKIILAIFLAKTRPDKAIFSDLTNLTIDFIKNINAEFALFTLSCLYLDWERFSELVTQLTITDKVWNLNHDIEE